MEPIADTCTLGAAENILCGVHISGVVLYTTLSTYSWDDGCPYRGGLHCITMHGITVAKIV